MGAGLPSIGAGQPIDLLLNSTTNALLLSQPAPERRPVLISHGEHAFARFDGKDDFLIASAPKLSHSELTVFVLAAPRSNGGAFSAMLGMAAFARNDYITGLNLDFGPNPTTNLSVLNVETAGSTGFRDLLTPGFFNAAERPFSDFHVFTVRTKPGKAGTDLFFDGFKGGERERAESSISLEQFVLGARIYSNDPNQPPFAQGHFDGAISEVLVYDRALPDAERARVEQYLSSKAAPLNGLLRGAGGHILEPVKNPPLVQMFVPGFVVEELPLTIGNLNNVRYRHDGKLVGQGYDGRIYLLTDTDGDGLEDKADLFWSERTLRAPIGIALTRKGDPLGDGVYVASKGKVSLILDQDRDGRAEEERILASAWPEPFHGVDTMGLAIDPKDGSIYFGRGCANFVEAYLLDKATGKSQYRLDDERGTIQRISPDRTRREIIATGVRFTCALAFNQHGDLFATDQEGATWLSNGNPLDELLHIQRGKHYGFPPRHPKHLPDVRDEPSVVEYGPQHQSTVGLGFNEGVNGGPHFGPAHWRGDALVCGESRGKLYRTRLAKTPLGYVGQNQLIASLGMLTVDSCVSPAGDLVVACHSGPPDWGTGPAGEGRIFKVRYKGKDLPQPAWAWAATPDEFRIAFDRPLDPSDWVNAQARIRIEAGEYVAAGDRFETIRPGYQVVRDQMAALRQRVDLLGLSLSEDQRTLHLRVPRQMQPLTYAITLPLPLSWKVAGGLEQHPEIDLAVTLEGIAAAVTVDATQLRTILPHPSLGASAELTRGSSEHAKFFQAAARPEAIVSLAMQVNRTNPYVPAVQPGSTLDWDAARDPFASRSFQVATDLSGKLEQRSSDSVAGAFQEFRLSGLKQPLSTANGLFLTDAGTNLVLSVNRFRVPWAMESNPSAANTSLAKARIDVRGHWLRGRRVFFGEGGCATCHTVRGEGVAFGPDLSNLIHRDRESVLHDIVHPSASLNPDHAGSLVQLADGTEYAGLVRALSSNHVRVALPAGVQLDLPRASVQRIEPMRTSLMPAGLDLQLEQGQLEDLLTFLLVEGLEPARVSRTDPPPPPPRLKSQVDALLASGAPPATELSTFKLLLVAGPKDHGPDEHDYPLWLDRWSRLLRLGDAVAVDSSMGFPSRTQLETADVAVFYNANPGWDLDKAAELDRFHRRGGGAVYVHYAVDGGKAPDGAAERIGLAFTLGSRFRHGDFDLVVTKDHPITRGIPTLTFTDETYWRMRGDASRLNVLGTSLEDNEPQPQLWTLERGQSRIVGCIPGHYTWTFDDPLFRVLLFRSICWAGKQDAIDRLAELALVGARVQNEPRD